MNMLMWVLTLYAVGTHDLVARFEHKYPTEEICRMEGVTVSISGKTYAVCAPVDARAAGIDTIRVSEGG